VDRQDRGGRDGSSEGPYQPCTRRQALYGIKRKIESHGRNICPVLSVPLCLSVAISGGPWGEGRRREPARIVFQGRGDLKPARYCPKVGRNSQHLGANHAPPSIAAVTLVPPVRGDCRRAEAAPEG
jgi:hypothetical protein